MTSIHPVPFGVNFIFPLLALVLISLDCTSRFPPNCGEVSSTTLEMPLPPPPPPRPIPYPTILDVDIPVIFEPIPLNEVANNDPVTVAPMLRVSIFLFPPS